MYLVTALAATILIYLFTPLSGSIAMSLAKCASIELLISSKPFGSRQWYLSTNILKGIFGGEDLYCRLSVLFPALVDIFY